MLPMAKSRDRGGRPRNVDVKRTPSGRASNAAPEPAGPTAEMKRQRSDLLCALICENPAYFAKELVLDQDAGWHVGRLYLVGLLTRRQKDAALRYRKAVAAYQAVLGIPKHPCAMDMNGVKGQSVESDKAHTRRFRRAKRVYETLHDALSAHGHDVVRAVTEALRENRTRLDLLKIGLDALDKVP